MPIQANITLKNQLSELDTLATAIEAFAQRANLTTKIQFNLNLALDELVTNIIHYAYNDTKFHPIEIALSYDDYLLNIRVTDDGKPFDPTQTDAPEFTKDLEQREVGGLGIHFVSKLMDKMTYQRINEQNQLTLEKQLHGERK